ncbi:MAG: sensor histidine kinase [Saprospiraceae bacterium]
MESGIQSAEFEFMITIGVLFMTAFALAFILFFNFSQRKLIAQKLKQQEELLYNIIKTQEEERLRIAKDLHDEIGSQLNIIKLNLHRLERKKNDAVIVKNTLGEIQELLGNTIQTTRQISHNLLPSVLDKFGLIAAINELSDNYQNTSVELSFIVEENTSKIYDKSIELNIFRVLQEFINNAVRHGEATLIIVQLWLNEHQLRLTLTDNGKGFDSNNKKFKAGLGLSNMNSRMSMIGGQINIKSIINEGTTANLLINLSKHDADKNWNHR